MLKRDMSFDENEKYLVIEGTGFIAWAIHGRSIIDVLREALHTFEGIEISDKDQNDYEYYLADLGLDDCDDAKIDFVAQFSVAELKDKEVRPGCHAYWAVHSLSDITIESFKELPYISYFNEESRNWAKEWNNRLKVTQEEYNEAQRDYAYEKRIMDAVNRVAFKFYDETRDGIEEELGVKFAVYKVWGKLAMQLENNYVLYLDASPYVSVKDYFAPELLQFYDNGECERIFRIEWRKVAVCDGVIARDAEV